MSSHSLRVQLYRVRLKFLPAILRGVLRPREMEPMRRLGSAYGGWWVPASAVRKGAVCYCAGAGEDISFDLALVAEGCDVTVFDPTPRAIAFVAAADPIGTGFRFVPQGWWHQQAVLKFFAPKDPSHVSHSVVNLQGTDDFFEAPVDTVKHFQAELGHDHVDVVKMDIEGAEYSVMESLLCDGPLPTVLCVEFDQPAPWLRTVTAVRSLRDAGFQLVRIEAWNYTFQRPGGHDGSGAGDLG